MQKARESGLEGWRAGDGAMNSIKLLRLSIVLNMCLAVAVLLALQCGGGAGPSKVKRGVMSTVRAALKKSVAFLDALDRPDETPSVPSVPAASIVKSATPEGGEIVRPSPATGENRNASRPAGIQEVQYISDAILHLKPALIVAGHKVSGASEQMAVNTSRAAKAERVSQNAKGQRQAALKPPALSKRRSNTSASPFDVNRNWWIQQLRPADIVDLAHDDVLHGVHKEHNLRSELHSDLNPDLESPPLDNMLAAYAKRFERIVAQQDPEINDRVVIVSPNAQMANRLRITVFALILGVLLDKAVHVHFEDGWYAQMRDILTPAVDILAPSLDGKRGR